MAKVGLTENLVVGKMTELPLRVKNSPYCPSVMYSPWVVLNVESACTGHKIRSSHLELVGNVDGCSDGHTTYWVIGVG